MLSFRFDLTSGQVRVLMAIYSGAWMPKNSDSVALQETQFISIVGRLKAKGLVLHSEKELRNGTVEAGFYCTDRGKEIARIILADAETIVARARLAQKRNIA